MLTKPTKSQKTNKKETTIARGNPLCSDNSEIPGMVARIQGELGVDDEIPLQGDSHASSSHEASLEPIYMRREELGKHNVHTHFPKTEIARSAGGPKLQELRAEDAKAKPYLVLTTSVT